MSALFSHRMPLFPDDVESKPSRPIEIISIADTAFQYLSILSNISPSMIKTIEELFALTCEVHRLRAVHLCPEERKSTTSRRARIERALYTSQFESSALGGPIQHCVRLAPLIVVFVVFRKTPNCSAILSTSTGQMQSELEKSDIFFLWDGHLEVLLWVLFLGTIVVPASDTTRKAYYISLLTRVCDQLGIQIWEEILEALRRIFMVRTGFSGELQVVVVRSRRQSTTYLEI